MKKNGLWNFFVGPWSLIEIFFLVHFVLLPSAVASEKISILTIEYPPIVYSEKGQPSGICVEIVRELIHAIGFESQFSFYPMARIATTLIEGGYDASIGATTWYKNDNLFDRIQFIDLINVQFFFFYKKDKFPDGITFRRLEDLKKYSIGNVRASASTKILESAKLKVDYSPNLEMAIKKLDIGRMDLVIAIDIAMWRLIRSEFPQSEDRFGMVPQSEDRFGMVPQSVFNVPISLIFKKEDSVNRQRFQKGLNKILKNGTFYKILEKYYGVGKVDINSLPSHIKKNIVKPHKK